MLLLLHCDDPTRRSWDSRLLSRLSTADGSINDSVIPSALGSDLVCSSASFSAIEDRNGEEGNE